MSFEFDGRIKEFPGVRVDNFSRSTNGQKDEVVWEYFLSHGHSDHLSGLETLVSGKIYMTHGTRAYLSAIEKYDRVLNNFRIHELAYNRPVQIVRNGSVKYHAMALDANHCPGSSMILLWDSNKAILYTGDVRAEKTFVEALYENPAIYRFTRGSRALNCIYVDSTFIYRAVEKDEKKNGKKNDEKNERFVPEGLYLDFPSNTNGIMPFINDELPHYLNSTYICCDGKVNGYEKAMLSIASALESKVGKVKIHLNKALRAIYEKTRSYDTYSYQICDYLLEEGENPENAHLHFCTKDECKIADKNNAVYIRFYVRPQLNQPTREIAGKNGKMVDTRLYVQQSRHSSLKEIQHLVSIFAPLDVVPIVDGSILHTHKITVESLFKDYCSSQACFSFDLLFKSRKIEPLALPSKEECQKRMYQKYSNDEHLMTRQRFAYDEKHNGETQSFDDDSEYEAPSSPINHTTNTHVSPEEAVPSQSQHGKRAAPNNANFKAYGGVLNGGAASESERHNYQEGGKEFNVVPVSANNDNDEGKKLGTSQANKDDPTGHIILQLKDESENGKATNGETTAAADVIMSETHEFDGQIARSANVNIAKEVNSVEKGPCFPRKRKHEECGSLSKGPTGENISIEVIDESVLIMHPLTANTSYDEPATTASSMIPTPQTPRKQILREADINEIPETPAQKLPTVVCNRIYLALSPKNHSPKKKSQPWESMPNLSSSQPIAVSSIAVKKKDGRKKRILTVRHQPQRAAKARRDKCSTPEQSVQAIFVHEFNEADILESHDEDNYRLGPVDPDRIGSIYSRINEEMSKNEYCSSFSLACI